MHVGVDRLAYADDHIEVFGKQTRDQRRRTRGVVGVVAVDHHVGVGFDVGEHAPHDMAFALQLHAVHDRTRIGSDLRRAVTRIVVEHMNRCIGQRAAEVATTAVIAIASL